VETFQKKIAHSLPRLLIAGGGLFVNGTVGTALKRQGIHCQKVSSSTEINHLQPSLLIIDEHLLGELHNEDWQNLLPEHCGVIAEAHLAIDADLYVPKGLPFKPTLKNIEQALIHALLNRQLSLVEQLSANKTIDLKRLADIGSALAAEKNLSTLLDRILLEGRNLVGCDAASLFLIDDANPNAKKLVFKLTQNASIYFPFSEKKFPLDESSIVGYVAIHGVELNVADAYNLAANAPYSFNHHFDETMNYRSISLLTLPMKNHRDEVIGVVQFINRTRQRGTRLSSITQAFDNVIAFNKTDQRVLRALVAQSAIAIENRVLIESINKLFDGFVTASVMAIEQRDPTTSGHSFRVSDLSLALAGAIPKSNIASLTDHSLNNRDMKQLKFAALLHDFGKVGVRESVLTKPKKLTAHQMDSIRFRIRLAQESLLRQMAETNFEAIRQGDTTKFQQLQHSIKSKIAELDQFWEQIKIANEPTLLPETISKNLENIHGYITEDVDGGQTPLLSLQELQALSIPKGSLTEEERLHIQSHVRYTENFLRLIPWTPELSNIPDIAAAHHEKLDGKGYPRGLYKDQIPLPSQIMTVCDIYDALTASDRPYKSAVPNSLAFSILENEAKAGMLNQDLVRVFIQSKTWKVIQDKKYGMSTSDEHSFHHNVCDFDLIHHHSLDNHNNTKYNVHQINMANRYLLV